jgi:hypothetical protein
VNPVFVCGGKFMSENIPKWSDVKLPKSSAMAIDINGWKSQIFLETEELKSQEIIVNATKVFLAEIKAAINHSTMFNDELAEYSEGVVKLFPDMNEWKRRSVFPKGKQSWRDD